MIAFAFDNIFCLEFLKWNSSKLLFYSCCWNSELFRRNNELHELAVCNDSIMANIKCSACDDYVTGCSLWTRMVNTAAENGVFFGFLSESDCTAVCLTSSSCVAVDLGPYGCVLHNDVDDLSTSYNAPGVTQLVLNRHCLPTTPPLTTTPVTTAAENYTASIGINIFFLQICKCLTNTLWLGKVLSFQHYVLTWYEVRSHETLVPKLK